MIIDDDSLEHYGVRGQKWGVRKARAKKVARGVATAGGVAYGAAAILTGAAFVASLMLSHGGSGLPALNANSIRNGRDIIDATSREVPYVHIFGALGRGT